MAPSSFQKDRLDHTSDLFLITLNFIFFTPGDFFPLFLLKFRCCYADSEG